MCKNTIIFEYQLSNICHFVVSKTLLKDIMQKVFPILAIGRKEEQHLPSQILHEWKLYQFVSRSGKSI